MADLTYEDFSAAANRMLAAKKAGQPESPVDRQIFEQGDPIHGKQFYKDYTAARSGGNIPIEDWKADPNIGPYALARTALPIAMAIPDLAVAAGNNLLDPLVNMGRKAVGAEPVAPTTLPSTAIKNALGVPNAPGNLQNILETGASLVGGALPAAGTAAANAYNVLPSISNAIRAGLGSLFKNAVVAPAASVGAGAVANWAGAPEPIKFLAGTAAGLAPSVLAPGAMRVAQNYFVPKYAAENAPDVSAAAARLGIPLRFGSLANPEGQAMEAGLRLYPATRAAAAGERPAMQAAADNIVAQRQALPAPTPETQQYVTAAENARANQPGPYGAPAPSASSAVNTMLNQNVGPRTPVDVGNTLNDINRIATPQGGTVSPEIGNSLAARGASLLSMATPPPPGTVGPVRPTVPWEQARSWRTNLGSTYPDMPAVKGAPYAQVYPTITSDLQRTAAGPTANQPVPPAAFRTVMDITRGEKAATSLGDEMRATVDAPSATGAKNFAQYVADLRQDPYQYRRITGAGTPNDVSQPISDLATVGRASYMPQKQGGAMETLGAVAKEAHPVISGPLNAILLNTLFGPAGAAVGGALTAAPSAWRFAKSEMLQRPSMITAMGGGPRSPYAAAPSMQDLIAALNAARIGQ